MIINIAVCDDKIEEINKIRACSDNYFARHAEFVAEYCEFTNSFEFLESIQKTRGYDIILLDICMPVLLGTDVAREIRQRKDKTEIIFITTSDEFAVDAFVLKATHYLIKPFKQAEFDEAMDRAAYKILSESNRRITFKLSGGSIQVVYVDDIIYIENFAHTQNVYLKDNTCFEAKESLAQFMSVLEVAAKNSFVSPYKGFIVNLKSIIKIEPDTIISRNGKHIPIVKRSFRDLQKKYFDFMFDEGGNL